MKYLFVGLLLNSIVTSEHETREACEGRATLLHEKGVIGKCIEVQQYMTWGTTLNPSIQLVPTK